MTSKKHFRFALALMLGASVGTLAVAAPAAAQDAANFERYANSSYNYCDAKLIGALYGQDAYAGKLIIGQKIANGIGSNIPVVLSESRGNGNACEWMDLPHSYEDAERLGAYWGIDTYRAKLKAATFYTNGYARNVIEALQASGPLDSERQALDAFFASGFSYCDAKLIGDLFGQTPYDGKVFIGNKIGFGLVGDLPLYLDQARDGGNQCRWEDLPYNYNDATRLAGLWNLSIQATKATVAKMVTNGRNDIVEAGLGRR